MATLGMRADSFNPDVIEGDDGVGDPGSWCVARRLWVEQLYPVEARPKHGGGDGEDVIAPARLQRNRLELLIVHPHDETDLRGLILEACVDDEARVVGALERNPKR